ncbi:FHA domain-containing protein FHA2-like [Phragmites australis]|uniref:FHA domain-containing protein FHA2-like n=1 Tax=Phragmites australis TaxID=29695 RepID=UPI002D78CEF8|nr:FHA domain-containing protein FHA2-like [Phragmites australis]
MGNARRRASPASDLEVGFAKLQGEGFEYYMQTYSIILGRHSRRKDPTAPPPEDDGVDVDLGALGGGMNVSRRHARIFYDFARRRFALEVLGKNGCLVEGVHHVPGGTPVKLDSQDLLQMGDAQFYFLLPSRSVFDDGTARCATVSRAVLPPPPSDDDDEGEEEAEDGADEQEEAVVSAKRSRNGNSARRSDAAGSKAYREADNQLLLQLEEKDVISSAATVLSDLCGPQEWVSVNNLHEVMFEKYGNIWHHSRVRKYLTSDDLPESETDGRPWHGLSLLLRKYPEHFVINIRKAGGQSAEFVSLVSLQP